MASAPRAGRRRRTAEDLASLERGEAAAPQPTFTIPLKPHVSAELADGATLSRVLHQEYATKLLESMGATPTKANLELIRKYAPLDQFSLKVSARKTGHSKDEVEVTPPAVVYDFKVQHMGCRAKPLEMVTLGIMQGRMNADKHTDVEHCFGMMEEAAEQHLEKQLEGKAAGEFMRKSRQFMFPYSLKEKPPAGVKELLKSLNMGMAKPPSVPPSALPSSRLLKSRSHALTKPYEQRTLASTSASTAASAPSTSTARRLKLPTFSRARTRAASASTRGTPQAARGRTAPHGSDDGGAEEREKDELQRELLRELGQTINVEQKDILSLQESFGVSLLDWKATDIADESLHSAISEADFMNTLRELGSALTVGLCRRMVQFLYNRFVAELDPGCKEQEELAFHIHHDYGVMCTKYRKVNSHLFFTLPITLMSLRSLVDSFFTTRFQLWVGTMEGKHALRGMDGTIMSMLDPHAYYTELSLFLSTSAAINILQGAFRKARRSISQRMYNTSPLTRTVLGTPAAPEARRLLTCQARANTNLAGGFAASKRRDSGEPSSAVVAHGALSDEHRKELYKLSTKLHSTKNALPDKRYGGAK